MSPSRRTATAHAMCHLGSWVAVPHISRSGLTTEYIVRNQRFFHLSSVECARIATWAPRPALATSGGLDFAALTGYDFAGSMAGATSTRLISPNLLTPYR